MHSSRMRTTRSLTLSRRILRTPPPGQNSWHTLLKILPCPKLRLPAQYRFKKWKFHLMRFHVEMLLLRIVHQHAFLILWEQIKPHVTNIAFKLVNPSVLRHVIFQFYLLSKGFTTIFTSVLQTFMCSHVWIIRDFLGESLFTLLTVPPEIPSVKYHVCF